MKTSISLLIIVIVALLALRSFAETNQQVSTPVKPETCQLRSLQVAASGALNRILKNCLAYMKSFQVSVADMSPIPATRMFQRVLLDM